MRFTLEIPDETGELVKGLTKFIGSIKEAMADGWQPGIDIPTIMVAAMSDLPAAIGGWEQLDDEAKANPEAMLAAGGLLASEIYKVLVTK